MDPALSAAVTLWPWQRRCLLAIAVGATLAALLAPLLALGLVLTVMMVPFLLVTGLRLAALVGLPHVERHADAARQHAPPGADTALPTYAVLVPLYREAEVVRSLLDALGALDYPHDRLDIVLIVEQSDTLTHTAIARCRPPAHVRVAVVPDGLPRTKPRALQYALGLTNARYVVVYDAEDQPEPDQLRRVVARFTDTAQGTACVQARLNVDNWDENWLTRQFAIEYTALFDAILPALGRLGLPLPLGGTSNHFCAEALRASGGWDPFNVTEDADLGIRLARQRRRVGLSASTTWEEAPSTLASWLGQRTRWLKGWMQTYVVHMRRPARLWRELGARRFIGFQVLMGGLILSALVHPWFYVLLAVDFVGGGGALWPPPDGVPRILWWSGLVNLVAGYAVAIALGAVAAARRGRRRLLLSALAMPAYWLLISFAAYAALGELARRPHHWRKTAHRARRPTARAGP